MEPASRQDSRSSSADPDTICTLSPLESVTISSLSSVLSEEDDAMDSIASPLPAVPSLWVEKHRLYYFEEANVQILVGRSAAYVTPALTHVVLIHYVLYNVPRTVLTLHSPWFRERLEQPAQPLPPGWIVHTSSSGDDIYINHRLEVVQAQRPDASLVESFPEAYFIFDVSAFEFDALLAILLPGNYNHRALDKEQWVAVLKLSTLWRFSSVRSLALRYLTPLLAHAPLERLVIARAYGVDSWVDSAIQDLQLRDTPLCSDEVGQLARADVVLIARARERHAEQRGKLSCVEDLRRYPYFTEAFKAKDVTDQETARRQAKYCDFQPDRHTALCISP
ncbi:unnamed protein product [Peniophora sp. CBMAI 1063]|nr:unnamed protein product [Peniophora sp. CBMAI 1063]